MPRLILFRHSEAKQAKAGQSDHQRPLTKRGTADAETAGESIAERGEKIELALVSDALRTVETWEGAKTHLKGKPEVRLLRAIYDAQSSYRSILRDEGGSAATILLVGHNPTMHATAMELVADLAGREGRALADGFPKSAFAVLDFDGHWKTLQARQMRLVAFVQSPS